MKDSEGNDEAGRQQKRTTTGSQTDEDSSKHLVETLEEINHKLEKENDHWKRAWNLPIIRSKT